MSPKDPRGAEAAAWIAGVPASLDDAAGAAARMLARSGQPLIAGLGADIEGARAAIALAERVGGVIDHMHSAAMLRDLDCLRETVVMLVTPGEARVRADVVLLVGDGLLQTWPHLIERLLAPAAKPEGVEVARRIVWLAPQADATMPGFDGNIEVFAAGLGATLASNLAALRARVKRRPVAQLQLPLLDALAAIVEGARFGVAIWTASSSRSARNRDAQWPRARLERNDAVLDIAARRVGQWRGCARGLWVDDRLPRANGFRR